MAKVTKTATTAATSPVDAGLDISKLTPAQLAALQKQLKEKRKLTTSASKPRFELIDKMLQEKVKNTKGELEFKNTTREIMNALVEAKLLDTTLPDYDTNEIKKIQARKQFLGKKTDEKGQLVHKPGTFGYKPSDGAGFVMNAGKVTKFFTDPENVKTLSDEQRKIVLDGMGVEE
jgi:hypothetical protein